MIEAKQAKELFTPLRGMPMEPTESGIIRSRYEALAQHARTLGHARRVVTRLAETLTYFPTISEIVNACETTPDDAEVIAKRERCICCGGTGYVVVERDGLTGAKRCNHSA